ncbi:Uncharacterised protein [Pandoraea pulmonicola]|uniref:Uncharacterized protein n=2 Tax=Pandoraea pulmonicola TaxID=93221 RepID=A0AAJ5D1Y1_PANPU|nr:Uncharacterised protein [Pandoraea pulmonicola]
MTTYATNTRTRYVHMIKFSPASFDRSSTMRAPTAAASHGADAPRENGGKKGMASNIRAVFNCARKSLAGALGGVRNFAQQTSHCIVVAVRSVFGARPKGAGEAPCSGADERNLKSMLRGVEGGVTSTRSPGSVRFHTEAGMVEYEGRQRVNLLATVPRQTVPVRDRAVPTLFSHTTVAASRRETTTFPSGSSESFRKASLRTPPDVKTRLSLTSVNEETKRLIGSEPNPSFPNRVEKPGQGASFDPEQNSAIYTLVQLLKPNLSSVELDREVLALRCLYDARHPADQGKPFSFDAGNSSAARTLVELVNQRYGTDIKVRTVEPGLVGLVNELY